jgi:tetratricopeptide (TPR) repeat protein
MKINELTGTKLLDKYLKDNYENFEVHKGIGNIYMWEDYIDKSIEIIKEAIDKFGSVPSLVILLSQCYKDSEGIEKAIELLKDNRPDENPEISIEVANLLIEEAKYEEAKDIIHKTYSKYPNNESVKSMYSKIAVELGEHEIALFFRNSLAKEFDTNSSYWGNLSNTALQLDYYDLAFTACRKAEELSKSKEAWIKSNIGNMLKNKGFYTESIKYFEKGIELDKKSDYAHSRLASSLKLKEKESKKVQISIKLGKKKIREYKQE